MADLFNLVGAPVRHADANSAPFRDCLILRPEFDPVPHLLSPGAADIIGAVAGGATLAQALDFALPTTDIPATLALLFGQGGVTRVEEPPQ